MKNLKFLAAKVIITIKKGFIPSLIKAKMVTDYKKCSLYQPKSFQTTKINLTST